MSPDNAHVLIRLAYSYLQSGNESEARSTYLRMSRIDPALAERFPLFAATDSPGTPPDGGSGPSPEARAARVGSGQPLFSSDWITAE
jgi:hypothetical protein